MRNATEERQRAMKTKLTPSAPLVILLVGTAASSTRAQAPRLSEAIDDTQLTLDRIESVEFRIAKAESERDALMARHAQVISGLKDMLSSPIAGFLPETFELLAEREVLEVEIDRVKLRLESLERTRAELIASLRYAAPQ